MNRSLQLQWGFCRVIDNFRDIGVRWRPLHNWLLAGPAGAPSADDASVRSGWRGAVLGSRCAALPVPAAHEAPPDVMLEPSAAKCSREFIAYSAYMASTTGQNPSGSISNTCPQRAASGATTIKSALAHPSGPPAGWTHAGLPRFHRWHRAAVARASDLTWSAATLDVIAWRAPRIAPLRACCQ